MSDLEDAPHDGEKALENGSSHPSPPNDHSNDQPEVEADAPHLEVQEQQIEEQEEQEEKGEQEEKEDTEDNEAPPGLADEDVPAVEAPADDPSGEASVASADASLTDAIPPRLGSPINFVTLAPDESPSVPGSHISSPEGSVLPSVASRQRLSSPTPSFRPFDRRFQSRISSLNDLTSPRPSSPAFAHGGSRDGSVSSSFPLDQADTDTPSPPWEVVRWTRLRKMGGQVFSEIGKRNFGAPTCLAVSTSIVLGTSRGIILVFDYSQNLKMVIGPGSRAVESGPITSLAISADHSTIAGGHANGNIFTWDTARPSKPFLTIPCSEEEQLQNRNADGHMPDVSVVHIGFLGTRHTALVSADHRGMAFSHLATRGTGALGRVVKTTRILGRYPNAPLPAGKSFKPSAVLAFGPLPLGNVERATDVMGLTAMLTPYLLVIVSTTPVAQTQYKSARPKDVAAHSAMTGCLAWFPAVRLKAADAHSGDHLSKVKLAYCWSNVLTVLDIDEVPGEERDQPYSLKFKARSRWKCEEAIAAVQWISRSVLAVLTISQRLIVLEDRSMRMTEAFDLLDRFIYHTDLFSTQLHNLVERLDESDTSMHGVVADAFYMSFKSYKGRMFLLGFNDVCIGALSNWADRLIATMEHGDYIGAIQLATSYYTGDADRLTVGLPDDAALRHGMVRDKILEIMGASLKFAFNRRRRQSDNAVHDFEEHLKQLAEACFAAAHGIGHADYLFEDLYDWYHDAGVQGIFFETLEPYILDKTTTVVPPAAVKDMMGYFVSMGWESRLEEIICHMDTMTLDLDQVTVLCKQHKLYDALIYVWNQGLQDFVTPIVELLSLLVPLMNQGEEVLANNDEAEYDSVNAVKIFPYLSYVLTGRVYPSGEPMDEQTAIKAKAEVYWLLFSGKTISWPKGSGREFLTRTDGRAEASFPYLRMILKFDAPSLLSALNEAFEDSFLNDSPEKHPLNGSSNMDSPRSTVNRQYILSILLDVMNANDFAPADTIYLDMFVARNLPKFPQYLLFPGSTLSRVLLGLCSHPGVELTEDAQLSTEYLLSVYHPSDMSALMPLFKKAGFYRILKRLYKTDKQYSKLLETYFEDPEDQELAFECIADCLRPQSGGLNDRQRQGVLGVIEQHARDLLELSPEQSAATLASQGIELHEHMLNSADDAPELQHAYLKTLLEPEEPVQVAQSGLDRDLVERYVRLMCKFDPQHVSDYTTLVQSVDLRLDQLLPTMEETGVIDAAVVLMAHEGQAQEAMARLIKHLGTLESAMQGLLNATHSEEGLQSLQASAEALLESLQKYVHVGIWLCRSQTTSPRRVKVNVSGSRRGESTTREDGLSEDEMLWLSLIDASVQITRRLSPAIHTMASDYALDEEKLLAILRSLVQHTFTALLVATSSQPQGQRQGQGQGQGQGQSNLKASPATVNGSNLSFLRILRAFLTQAAVSLPNLADLRAVLASIFSAYAYEESILQLSNRLLERSLFTSVGRSVELRQRGWRPRGSTCEACGKRVWGPGVAGGAVYEAWEDKQCVSEAARRERQSRAVERAKGHAAESADSRAKGKTLDTRPSSMLIEVDTRQRASAGGGTKDQPLGPLVVLACRHIYHQSCLDSLQEKQENGGAREREYRCPIDG